MKIFYGDNDGRDYNNPDAYAFMNWRFDDGLGMNNGNNKVQMISDNYQMGKGYLGNALLSLFTIVDNKNQNNVADIMIFPIMFDIWHGIELWLKSICTSLSLLYREDVHKDKKNHNIDTYFAEAKDFLNQWGLKATQEKVFSDLDNLISEFKRVNANFDFARYSFDRKDEYQFYNAPFKDNKQWQKKAPCIEDDKIVPNTCVDLCATFELVANIFESFGIFVEYLMLVLENNDIISDESYSSYLNTINSFKKEINQNDDTDFINILLREIS